MFRFLGPAIILLIQYLVWRKAMRILREGGHRPLTINVITGLFLYFNLVLLLLVLQPVQLLDIPVLVRNAVLSPLFMWHGATFFIAVLLLVGLIIKLAVRGTGFLVRLIPVIRRRVDETRAHPGYHNVMNSRRAFLRKGTYALTGVSFAGTAYGMFVERSRADVTEVELNLTNLDPRLDGFAIGLLSDIHSSVNMPRTEMDKYVARTNSLGCDLVVVTGDFVNSSVDEVYPFAESFSALKAPMGVYGVMGNHDYYNANPDLVAREVEQCGIQLLFDDSVPIRRDGHSFSLLGIDDVGSRSSAEARMKTALRRAQDAGPKVLLCHRPYYLPEASALGIDLVLSGHTHGGQIVLGRFGETIVAPASLASRYVRGLYREGECAMYVSRGIGTVGVPVRFNCPPEITRIVLRSGPVGARGT